MLLGTCGATPQNNFYNKWFGCRIRTKLHFA